MVRFMAPTDKDQYRIHRIRLIKFHNIENETIDLNGHLFLLGDNGSGKTTILDAVHYVLTGGDLEFNSAARVAGPKTAGRSSQGIVMRYNADTGALNKNGGVTYAAIELTNERGKILTIGLGMSTSSMEESTRHWGIIEAKPLESIPFLMNEIGGDRPASREELKKMMGPKAGIFLRGAYKKELARRIFSGPDGFPDVCRLLSMGKAYREMVARSADYHELFVKLLPEPKTDIFQRLVEGLHDLDGARAILDEMGEKAQYLEELQTLRDNISAHQEEIARYKWLTCHYRIEQLKEDQEKLANTLANTLQTKADALEDLNGLERKRDHARTRLDDLKARDQSGLVRQEKDLARQLEHLDSKLDSREIEVRGFEKEVKTLERSQTRDRNQLGKVSATALKDFASFQLPFPLTDLMASLDQRARATEPETTFLAEPEPFLSQASRVRDEIQEARVRLEETQKLTEKTLAAEEEELARLLDRKEAEIERVSEARRILANHMIDARPLYESLAWKPAIRQKTMAEVEAFIGSQVLGTLIVDEAHFQQAKEILFETFSNLPITHEGLGLETLPQWMRDTFDLTDPFPLTILAGEMASTREPQVDRNGGYPVLSFRSHQQRLDAEPPRFIGSEARRKAWERACKKKKDSIKDLKIQIKAFESEIRTKEESCVRVEQFSTMLRRMDQEHRRIVNILKTHSLNLSHLNLRLEAARTELLLLGDEKKASEKRLTGLRNLIEKEGLHQLERKMARVEKEVSSIGQEIDGCQRHIGRIESQIKSQEARSDEMTKEKVLVQKELDERATLLAQMKPEIEDLAYYVLRTWKGFQFGSQEKIDQAALKAERDMAENKGTLRQRLADPTMASSYAFFYNEEENSLIDRRSRTLDEALIFQNTAIENQNQVINEKTVGLFKEIILNELVRVLREQMFGLKHMVKHINKLLSDRQFGNNRYQFHHRKQDRFKDLVDIIHQLHAFEEESEKNLREFFEDHQQEILNTEPGDVPDILDYRNWFHFEMTVSTAGKNGEEGQAVTMNRRVKASGSGGEQAVPNYLLVLTIAYFLYNGSGERKNRLHTLLFDEAFYGIDAGRRDQLLGFADDLGLQLLVASPDQDGVKNEIAFSKTLLVMKDELYDVHLHEFDWENPMARPQLSLLEEEKPPEVAFKSVKEPK